LQGIKQVRSAGTPVMPGFGAVVLKSNKTRNAATFMKYFGGYHG
jgi:hypothetical protein